MPALNSYYLVKGGEWPEAIEAAFGDRMTVGAINVAPDSPEEARVIALCETADILGAVTKVEYLYSTGDELQDDLWYYLQTEPVREIPDPLTSFFDMTTACGGADRFRCNVGAQQIGTFAFSQPEPYDIEHIHAFGELFFVSDRCKRLIEAAGFTGCRFLSPGENSVRADSHNLVQMIIDTEVSSLPEVGEVRITRRCPKCATVYQFVPDIRSGSSPYFKAGDLATSDFQIYRAVRSSNEGDLSLAFQVPLVSGRVLKHLLGSGISGLSTYSDEPLIPFRTVPVR